MRSRFPSQGNREGLSTSYGWLSLAILFDTSDGSIHAQGNRAAHEATLESKLFAVSFGDDLPLERRDNMLKLLRFAYDV